MFLIEVMTENLVLTMFHKKRVGYSRHSHVMAKFVSEGICSIQVPYVSTMGAFLVDVDLHAVKILSA